MAQPQSIGLETVRTPALPLDTDVLFTNHKNVRKKAIEKRQARLLKRVSFLRPFLKEDERILLVTTACSPMNLLEWMLTGWMIVYLKRALLVFTNKRVLHIPTRTNYSWRHSIAQILYGDCKEIRLRWGNLRVQYRDGRKEQFPYVASSERKKIRSLVEGLPLAGEQSQTPGRTFLCPRCATRLFPGGKSCTNCHLEFKSREEARKISLLLPGGGYFYTRHPWLGAGDAFVELFLMVALFSAAWNALRGVPGAAAGGVVWAVLLGIEKAITVYHANHYVDEFIPKDRTIEPTHGAMIQP